MINITNRLACIRGVLNEIENTETNIDQWKLGDYLLHY